MLVLQRSFIGESLRDLFALNSLSILVWNDESLRSRSITCTRPEERVDSVAVVIEVYDEKSICIDCVDITTDLMVVRIEFSYEFALIRPVLIILLAVDCERGKSAQRKKKLKVKLDQLQIGDIELFFFPSTPRWRELQEFASGNITTRT